MQIAQAFVAIRAQVNPSQFKSDVTRGITQPMTQAGAAAGKQAGQAAGKGVGAGLSAQASAVRSSLASIFAGAVFAKGVKGAIDSAKALEEQVSGTGAVFADARGEIDKFAEGAAQGLGQSEEDARRAANTFGGLFRALGVTEADAAKFSITLTTLATDLASLKDTPIEDAFLALQSGLVGEAEPLRRFGISLSEARLQQEALSLGLAKGKGPLDAAAKAQAALSIILKDSKLAQGDFNRTRESAANTEKRAAAELKNSSAALGQNLLPAYQRLSEIVGALARVFADLPGPIQTSAVALAGIAIVAKPIRELGGLVGALPARFTDAEGGATRLSSTVKGLGRALGVAGAAVVAFEVVNQLLESLGEGAPDVERMATALDRFRESGELTGVLEERFGRNANQIGLMVDEVLSLKDAGGGFQGFAAQVREGVAGNLDDINTYKSAIKALDELLAEMVASGDVSGAAALFRLFTDQVKGSENGIQGLIELTPKYSAAQRDATEATKAGSKGLDVYNISLGGTRKGAALTAEELQKLADSLFATSEAQLDAADASQNLRDAQTDLAELQETAAGRGAAQVAALEQIADANRRVVDATESHRDAVRSLQDAREELAELDQGDTKRIRELERRQIVSRVVTTADEARAKELDLLKFDQSAADERERLQEGIASAEEQVRDAADAVKDAQDDVRKANREREQQQLEAAAKIIEAEREVQRAALDIATAYVDIVAKQGISSQAAQVYRDALKEAEPVLQHIVDLNALLAETTPRPVTFVPATPEILKRTGLSIGDITGGRNFATGGVVPGTGPVPIMAHGGETVIPAGQSTGVSVNQNVTFVGGDIPTVTQLDALNRKTAIRVRNMGRKP